MFNKIIKRGSRKPPKASPDSSSSSSSTTTTSASPSIIRATLTSSVPIPPPSSDPPAASSPPPSFSEPLPSLRDCSPADRPALLLRKLRLCSSASELPHQKELKRGCLLDLLDFLQSSPSPRLPEPSQEELIRMVSSNIFRCLPPHPSSSSPDPSAPSEADEDEPFYDPSWPHLQLVYELLLRYVVSPDTDTKVAKRYLDHSFVLRLLDLFDSEDPREREYLKTILHRIYGKFMVHRPFIRKAINNVFYRYVLEVERFSGIAELLEILGSIINGFALPLKEEHKLFLVRALIPLHKPKGAATYYQQLTYCITQFVEKDYKLADTVIRGLLKYWPVTNCQKEVLFLGELEEVLEATQSMEFQKCMVPLFKQIGRCLNSSHFQVAERALFLWNNDHIVSLIAQNRTVILPIIYGSLDKNLQGHWNQAVHGLTTNVRKMFLDMDSDLFEECQRQYAEKQAKAGALEAHRQLAWKRLEEVASVKLASP